VSLRGEVGSSGTEGHYWGEKGGGDKTRTLQLLVVSPPMKRGKETSTSEGCQNLCSRASYWVGKTELREGKKHRIGIHRREEG